MAELKNACTKIEATVTLVLNEEEIRAIDALTGYGIESFLKVFYERLGRAYLQPHEAGLRSFFESVSGIKGYANAAHECREFMRKVPVDG